jgi:xanthine dehydrogenase YagS FAD-binding subunit
VRDFGYVLVRDAAGALATLATRSDSRLIAGGTDLINLLKDDIVTASTLVDINPLGLRGITCADGLTIGALATMSDVAAHPGVRRDYPVLSQALTWSASPQLRNMATIGGNLLQRTRCPYFRAETPLPCNKREPGSGCSAIGGAHRLAAIFGASEHCVATHPSDLAVALSALDARVTLRSPVGERTLPIDELYRLPGDQPDLDTVVAAELITEVTVPVRPETSSYLKVRERASYEFALVSVAVVLDLDGDTVRTARIAVGGVAAKPWRLTAAEDDLLGARLSVQRVRAAVDLALVHATPLPENAFKVELCARAVVKAVLSHV